MTVGERLGLGALELIVGQQSTLVEVSEGAEKPMPNRRSTLAAVLRGRRRRSWGPSAAAALLAATLALGCDAGQAQSSPPATPASGSATPPAPRRSPAGARISEQQALRIAGEHVIYAYAGERPPASLIGAIRAGEAAGVILFAPNVASPAALAVAVQRMQAAARTSPEPARLLILTDQEGGQVRRLAGAPALSEQQIGASPNGAALATQAGRAAAANLSAAGVNVNLAPVLDVFRTPGDFIDQFGRSYSDRASVVARLGAAFIAAQQSAGVAATAKHFPGLGSATRDQDTDLAPVRLPLGLAALRGTDEAPYRAAIRAGVKLVMVSWATYPALDRSRPAGLSARVIHGELRSRLHFRGVTITDGIEAGALRVYGDVARRSVLATAAGADLILACAADPAENSPRIGLDAVHAVADALSRGTLSLAAAQRSAARVLALRSSVSDGS